MTPKFREPKQTTLTSMKRKEPPSGDERKTPSPKQAKVIHRRDNKRPDPFLSSPHAISISPQKNGASRDGNSHYKDSTLEIEHGIVLRKYYPPEMTNERAKQYIEGKVEKPIDTLDKAIKETKTARDTVQGKNAIVFWFKNDLRLRDNRGFSRASQLAQKHNLPLICLYLCSPQDWEAHLTAAVRVGFTLRSLEVLQKDLAERDIPLYIESVEKRKNLPGRLIDLCKEWDSSHVFCNVEYEVDELRREARLTRDCLDKGISFTAVADTCVVSPGSLSSGSGKQYAVYSPWFRAWCSYLNSHPKELEEASGPTKNPPSVRTKFAKLFDCTIPSAPSNKSLSSVETTRFRSLWPAGEHEAQNRLSKFLKERINGYKDNRNFPWGNTTSVISPHLAAGTLSARDCVRAAVANSSSKKVDGGSEGVRTWISEVAWRDFYKHVLVGWPFICMNKPFKPEYSNIRWEYNTEHFNAWCEGKTGFPIVDAAMRQARETGWMHNRCRMIVANFLSKDLLLDWRMGERWFMEHLVDGDFASNNGGWGFSASVGVDPQPYFRIFNPLLQSEKFDANGDYIRKWVPELKEVKGKAIHEPYARGAEAIARKAGYPRPIVEHKGARARALERYKDGLAGAKTDLAAVG